MKKICLILALAFSLTTQAYAHVNLLTPTGGETYNSGDTVTLQWQIAISHTLQNWDLFFSEDGGTIWDTIEIDIPSTGNTVGTLVTYEWVVPTIATNQARIWILMDNAGTDYQDISGDFTIGAPLGIFGIPNEERSQLFPSLVQTGEKLNLIPSNNISDPKFILIADLNGKIVKQQSIFRQAPPAGFTVELDGLSNGLYYLILVNRNDAIIDRKTFLISRD